MIDRPLRQAAARGKSRMPGSDDDRRDLFYGALRCRRQALNDHDTHVCRVRDDIEHR
jgi:hypothetical protein